MAKRLEVDLKSQLFDESDPMTFLIFLPVFQMAYDMNGINEGPNIWLLHAFMKNLPVPLSAPELALRAHDDPVKKES